MAKETYYKIKKRDGSIILWSYDKLETCYKELGLTEMEMRYLFFNFGTTINGVSIVGTDKLEYRG